MKEAHTLIWKRITREPLFHFLLIGIILSALHWLFVHPKSISDQANRSESDELRDESVVAVRIDQRTIAKLVENHEQVLERQLTDKEREGVIEKYAEQEILYREAIRLRLNENDPFVRDRLIAKMKFVLDEPIGEPGPDDLERLYVEKLRSFPKEERLTLQHVFISTKTSQSNPGVLEKTLAQIGQQANFRRLGELHPAGAQLTNCSRSSAKSLFGATICEQLISLPLNEWHGPLKGAAGFHFVRVQSRTTATPPPLKEVKQVLISEWIQLRKQTVYRAKMHQLRERYQIFIGGTEIGTSRK